MTENQLDYIADHLEVILLMCFQPFQPFQPLISTPFRVLLFSLSLKNAFYAFEFRIKVN